MGRVFTFAEIEAGHYPRPGAFEAIRHDIQERVEGEPDLLGGILAGSVLHGTPSVRSDVDLVLYVRDTPYAHRAIRELRRRAAQRYVPLNVVPVDQRLARTRFHTLTWGFVQHLHYAARHGGQLGPPFLQHLRQDHLDPLHDLTEYLGFKLRYLARQIDLDPEQLHEDDPLLAETLGKGLELPVHLARKLLLLGAAPGDDSKQAVQQRFTIDYPDLAPRLQELVVLDQAYQQALQAQLERPQRPQYRQALQAVVAGMPAGLEFMRQVAWLLDTREHSLPLSG